MDKNDYYYSSSSDDNMDFFENHYQEWTPPPLNPEWDTSTFDSMNNTMIEPLDQNRNFRGRNERYRDKNRSKSANSLTGGSLEKNNLGIGIERGPTFCITQQKNTLNTGDIKIRKVNDVNVISMICAECGRKKQLIL